LAGGRWLAAALAGEASGGSGSARQCEVPLEGPVGGASDSSGDPAGGSDGSSAPTGQIDEHEMKQATSNPSLSFG